MTKDFKNLKLFITGPTYIRDEIKNAALLPEFGHRDTENDKRFKSIFENLKKIAGVGDDYEVILIPGSGSSAMEASIKSLVDNDEIVLNVSVGAFGDLFHKISKAVGKDAKLLKFNAGSGIDLNILEQAIIEYKPKVVTFTHNETSTGVRNDVYSVCNLIKKYGAMPIVDGVSIFGGAKTDIEKAGVGMYCGALQKSLALPSGFGVAILSPEAIEKAKNVSNRGYTTDILSHLASAKKNQILTTPNCSLANQLYAQLKKIVEEEGIEKRFERHEDMRNLTHNWTRSLPEGFDLFADKNYSSPTLTTVRVPENFDIKKLKEIKEKMREKGYLFDPGYGKLNKELEEKGERPIFRIGHMGDVDLDMLKKYLTELNEVLKEVQAQ